MSKLNLKTSFYNDAATRYELVAAVAAASTVDGPNPVASSSVAEVLSLSYSCRLGIPVSGSGEFFESLFETIDAANDIDIEIESDEINGESLNANVFTYETENYLVVFWINEDTDPQATVFSLEALLPAVAF